MERNEIIKDVKYIALFFISMNKVRTIYKSVEKFNIQWSTRRSLMKDHIKFTEQWYYVYDHSLIGAGSDIRENLQLYANLLQRLDITNLRFQFVKIQHRDCVKVYHFCIYMEKGDLYIENRAEGCHRKIFLSHWIQDNKIIHRENIPVEVEWVM